MALSAQHTQQWQPHFNRPMVNQYSSHPITHPCSFSSHCTVAVEADSSLDLHICRCSQLIVHGISLILVTLSFDLTIRTSCQPVGFGFFCLKICLLHRLVKNENSIID